MSGWARLWVLTRPRLWLCVLAIPMTAYGWAHWDRALPARQLHLVPVLLIAWSLLHVGTMWLNACLDRDEGEVLLGRSVPVPGMAWQAAWCSLLLAGLVGFQAGASIGLATSAAGCLAVLYSHPLTVWKGHPLGGPFVNLVGYGMISPWVGWSLAEVAMNARTAAIWMLGLAAIAGATAFAQAMQEREDRARGYRTLVVTHGPVRCIEVGRIGLGIAMLGAMLMCLAGWLPRVCLLVAPLCMAVDRVFHHWRRSPDRGGFAGRLAGRCLLLGIVLMGLVTGEYLVDSMLDRPVAGLSTRRGHPEDRPRLSPAAMRQWEARKALESRAIPR